MRARLKIAASAVALFGAALISTPSEAPENIPTVGDAVVQQNITGTAKSVVVLPQDYFVIAGETDQVKLVGSDLKVTAEDGLLIKYHPVTLQPVWIATENFGVHDAFSDVVADASGNLYVSGYTYTDEPRSWGWLFKFNTDGQKTWGLNYTYPGSTSTDLRSLVWDGLLLVAGGGTRVDSQNFPVSIKVSQQGELTAERRSTELGGYTWNSIALTDTSGNYFGAGISTGSTTGSFNNFSFSGTTWSVVDQSGEFHAVAASGSNGIAVGHYLPNAVNIFINSSKYSSGGTLLWFRNYGSGGISGMKLQGQSVVVGSGNSVFVAGYNGTITFVFSENPLQYDAEYIVRSPVTGDAVSLKYADSGDLLWATEYGELSNAFLPWSNALDSVPRLIVVGSKSDLVSEKVYPYFTRYSDV